MDGRTEGGPGAAATTATAATTAGGDGKPAEGPAEGYKSRPRAAANQEGPEEAGASRGEGDSSPHRGRGRPQGSAAGGKPNRPSSPRGREEDEIQVVGVQPGKVTLPTRVREQQY